MRKGIELLKYDTEFASQLVLVGVLRVNIGTIDDNLPTVDRLERVYA